MNPSDIEKAFKTAQIPGKKEFNTLDHAIVLNKLAKTIENGGDFLISEYINTPEALIEYTKDIIATNDVKTLSDALNLMSNEIQELRKGSVLPRSCQDKHTKVILSISETTSMLIESGIYDENMKLTPGYKYIGLEREKHEEAVLIIKEVKKNYSVGDYWIPNIDSESKTTLILLNTNIEDDAILYSEMKEILNQSRFFDNISSEKT